jgi:hypothetical protein
MVNYLVLFGASRDNTAVQLKQKDLPRGRRTSTSPLITIKPSRLHPLRLMARTKQTGRKSTGGTAPQTLSPPMRPKETSALIASADPQPTVNLNQVRHRVIPLRLSY